MSSNFARFGPAALPVIPDVVPRLGATPQVREEFRVLSRRLLAHAESLSSADDRGRPRPSETRGPGVRLARNHRRSRLWISPPVRSTPPDPELASAAVSGVNRAAVPPPPPATSSAVVRSSLLRPAPLPAAVGDVRLHSSDDVAMALGCRRLPGTGDANVLVRSLRARVPLVLPWVESLLPNLLPVEAAAARAAGGPRGTLFLDIETAGLAHAPILLVGCARVVGTRLVLRQYLAADYPSEQGVLRAVEREIRRSARVVTFNGASFDIPAIRDRAVLWGLPAFREPLHVDLLPHARRAWRGYVANCRLGTLEAVILGRMRHQDLPSRDVPEAFHRFLRGGDPSVVAPIVRHNAFDVISMAGLAAALGVPV